MLSEEIFDFGNEMVSKRVYKLMDQLTCEFKEVFDLCMFILLGFTQAPAGNIKESLIIQTLKCLSHFLRWIPLGFIFETDLIKILINHFWEPVQFRPECIRCITEIASLNLSVEEQNLFNPKLKTLWFELFNKINALPKQTLKYEDPAKVPPQMRLFWESIYCQLALCLTGRV